MVLEPLDGAAAVVLQAVVHVVVCAVGRCGVCAAAVLIAAVVVLLSCRVALLPPCRAVGLVAAVLVHVGIALLVGTLSYRAANDGTAGHSHYRAYVAAAWAAADAAYGGTEYGAERCAGVCA